MYIFSYVQEILAEHQQKEVSVAGVGGGATARHPGSMAGMMPVSQVDIMQMLSKAQQEYDTVSLVYQIMFDPFIIEYVQ